MRRNVYSKSPIVEAIIDVGFVPEPNVSAVDIAIGMAGIQADYPERADISSQSMTFQLAPGAPPSFGTSTTLAGFRYINELQTKVLQVRTDGFTFSHVCDPNIPLKRYSAWELLRNESMHLWSIFQKSIAIKSITRLGIRYINRMDLPFNEHDLVPLENFLKIYPVEPKELTHHDYSKFAVQLVLPQPDIQADVVINQGIHPAFTATHMPQPLPVLLDIEIQYNNNGAPIALSDAMWGRIEQLHTRANETFEACITEQLRELIR